MGASFYGELVIRTTMDTTGVSKGVAETNAKVASMGKSAERSLGKTGLAMQNVGRTMTQYYTLPVTLGLGYATYAAYKYQKAMIQVQNLTGLSATQAARFSDEIRQASAEIGNEGGPQAAAEAFYFLASSGLDAKEAMDALRVSMKASVAGMGDITVLADVVTSAMNSYGHGAYNATQAMDILMRTIEVGKAEPTALASSLGRIMPIANQLKVSLEELGGNVAALTLGGLSSAEAVTALRGTMVALVSPAKMSIDELKTMGLTYKEVTKSIAEKGLLPTLKMLWEATDHNMLSLRKIIPNVRATTGVMSLLGANYEKNLEIIDRVNDSQGKLNETYKTAAQSDVAKFNRALNGLKSTFIEVGAVVLPMVTMLVEAFGDLIGVFKELPPWLQKTSVYFLAITAAMWPIISVAGSVMRAIELVGIKRAVSAAAAAAETASNAALTASNASVAASETTVAGATGARAAASVAASKAISASAAAAAAGVIPETGALYGLSGASTAASVGILGLVGALTAAAGVGLVGALGLRQVKKLMDEGPPSFEKMIERIQKTAKESKVDIPIRIVAKDTDLPAVRKRLNRLTQDGKIYLTVDAVDAWVELYSLSDYVKDDDRWKINIAPAHGPDYWQSVADEITRSTAGGIGLPIAAHIMPEVSQRQLTLKAMEVTDIFEKVMPPPEVPITWKDMTRSQQAAFIAKMTPKQQILFNWGLIKKDLPKVRPPKIDFAHKDFQGDLSRMERWINKVVRTRELTIEVRKERVKKGIAEIEGEIDRVRMQAKKTGWTAELKAKKDKLDAALKNANAQLTKLENRTVKPVVGLDTTSFDEGVRGVIASINSIPSVVNVQITTSTTPIDKSAWGGIFTKPKVTLVGEEGPEAIIPLTKPGRAAQLLAASGLSKYVEQRPTVSGIKEPRQEPRYAGPAEVHYHSHTTLPQGIIVSDVERFGRQLQPFVERGTLTAQRRRERGMASR